MSPFSNKNNSSIIQFESIFHTHTYEEVFLTHIDLIFATKKLIGMSNLNNIIISYHLFQEFV